MLKIICQTAIPSASSIYVMWLFPSFFISGSFSQLYTHKIHVTVHDEK